MKKFGFIIFNVVLSFVGAAIVTVTSVKVFSLDSVESHEREIELYKDSVETLRYDVFLKREAIEELSSTVESQKDLIDMLLNTKGIE